MKQQTMRHASGHVESGWHKEVLPRAIRPERPHPLRTLVFLTSIIILSALIGVSSAYILIEREEPLDSISVGAWKAYPTAGTPEADPYSVAIYTRGGYIPLASGEGLSLTARTDSSGQALDPACSYRIAGRTPTARLWTLTAVDAHGRLQQTVPGRNHLDSQNLLRRGDGSFEITASAQVKSGNWLPLPTNPAPGSGLRFVLRLYDAPVTTGAALDGVSVPDIDRISCP